MISAKYVWETVKSPSEVEQIEEPNILGRIYGAIYIAIRLLLDIRSNQVKIAAKLGIDLQSEKSTINREVK